MIALHAQYIIAKKNRMTKMIAILNINSKYNLEIIYKFGLN